MASVRLTIRYSYLNKPNNSQRITSSITASVPGRTVVSALNFLQKKYPDRHDLQVIELIEK
jgi:hypothetical protein